MPLASQSHCCVTPFLCHQSQISWEKPGSWNILGMEGWVRECSYIFWCSLFTHRIALTFSSSWHVLISELLRDIPIWINIYYFKTVYPCRIGNQKKPVMSEKQWFTTLDSHLKIFKCHDSSRMAILGWRMGNKPQKREPSHLLLQGTQSYKTSLESFEIVYCQTLLTSAVIYAGLCYWLNV